VRVTRKRLGAIRHRWVLGTTLMALASLVALAVAMTLVSPGWAMAGLDWVRGLQAEYQLALKDAVLALREEHAGKAALALAGLSFLYGVLHAAGPGHGKAVIATYAATNLRQVRRAVILSFGAGIVQALSAIGLVTVAFVLIGGGARWATRTGDQVLEPASYAIVAALGAWVVVRSGWPLLRRLWVPAVEAPAPAHDHTHHHGHNHDHADHGADCGCGHAHMPTPKQAAEVSNWRQIVGLSIAIGLRPCTGAILVLILSFGLGLWGAGIAAALVMGLGTALTVSVLAVLASTVGKAAVPAVGGGATWPRVAGLAGGLVILALGIMLFLAAIARPVHPLL